MGSRTRGNSTKRNTIQTDQTPHSHTELPQRHSRPRGNDGVFLSGVGVMGRWIPAHAGIQRKETPSRLTRLHSRTGLPQRHSREGGNPQFPRTREFNEKKHHPDWPDFIPTQNYLNVIPAHAGIQRRETPSRLTRLHSHTGLARIFHSSVDFVPGWVTSG